MEQTVNLFSKGLQMDTHPMVLGNDTLSDALNATFVTMNGNEVILQNDMGNRRIDNAFLPSGYEPVGIKEHGGIIYVACYNPITRRGLVGSFPSPERKKGGEKNNSQTVNLQEFFSEPGVNGKPSVKTDSTIILLTEESLHAGDKFCFKSTNLSLYIKYLVPTQVDGHQRNNLYTMLIGVFNSLNLFIDITELLKTFVVNDGNDNFNFFIEEGENLEISGTLNDLAFIKNRQTLDINVYSLKLVSPLYLKTTLNYIKNYSYEINGEENSNDSLTIYIKARYEYNCPSATFPIRFTYDNNSQILLLGDGGYYVEETLSDGSVTEKSPVYNELTELWETEIEYSYVIGNYNGNTLTCTIEGLLEPIPSSNELELINLLGNYPIITNQYTRTLNINDLGKDIVRFQGWRYYNNVEERTTRIVIDLDAYPKYKNSKLRGLLMFFHENDYDNNYKSEVKAEIPLIENRITGSGAHVIEFNWPEELEERKLYKCFLKVLLDSNEELSLNNDNEPYWFLTTELFNGNFDGNDSFKLEGDQYVYLKNKNQGQWVESFSNFVVGENIYYNYEEHLDVYIEDFTKIKKILIRPSIEFKNSSNITKSGEVTSGDIISSSPEYSITDTFDIQSNIYFRPILENEELYPTDITNHVLKFTSLVGTAGITFNGANPTIFNYSFGEYNSLEEANEDLREIINYPIENLRNVVGTITGQKILFDTGVEGITNLNGENYHKLLGFNQNTLVNNFIIGKSISKYISCNNLITSFSKFVLDNGLNYITKPIYCIDSENGEYFHIRYVDSDTEDPTDGKESTFSRRLTGKPTYYSVNKNLINSYLNLFGTDSIFLGELNSNDWVVWKPNYIYSNGTDASEKVHLMFKSNEYSGDSIFSTRYLVGEEGSMTNTPEDLSSPLLCYAHKAYKRIWLRISLTEFVPILIREALWEEGNKLDSSIEKNAFLDFSDIKDDLLQIIEKVPHYFVFKTGKNSFLIDNILDVENCYKSKEFNIPLYVSFDYSISSKGVSFIDDKYFSIFGIDESNYKGLTLTFKDSLGNIYSNSKLLDIIESLESLEFNTIARVEDTIKIFDNKGEFFDSNYTYYYKEGKLIKWYFPDTKYTITGGLFLPSLIYNKTYNLPKATFTYLGKENNAVIGVSTSQEASTLEVTTSNTYGPPTEIKAVFVLRDHNYYLSRDKDLNRSLFFDELPDIFTIPT